MRWGRQRPSGSAVPPRTNRIGKTGRTGGAARAGGADRPIRTTRSSRAPQATDSAETAHAPEAADSPQKIESVAAPSSDGALSTEDRHASALTAVADLAAGLGIVAEAQEEIRQIKIDLMTVKLRPVDTGEFHFVADDEAAGTTHTGAVHHDRIH